MPPAIDEFEDLTQFADESFDNDEVDLFEFTDDEESPLLRLKSIVLSLDWDITEDTLAELTEELSDLRSLWDGDKVAQIYLQGMDNIGKYLQKEGAYAHPNAIKLLLTLFYNYEKIISSSSLSSEAVATMLKADVRKFKVLQYQIGTTGVEGHAEEQVEEYVEKRVETVPPPEKIIARKDTESASVRREKTDDPLTSMEATILGLEWEVTQDGLEKFHNEATELREHLTDNRDAQILVQGLQALGSYIREEKTNAHPDSFTILHAFYDALKLLIQDTNLTAEQRKQVLIEQIGSLNSLKAIIAKSAADKSAEEEKIGSEDVEVAKVPAPEQELEDESEPEFDSPVTDDDDDLDLFSEDFDESSDFFLDGDDNLSDDDLIDEESIAGDFGFDEEENGLDFGGEAGELDFSLDGDIAEDAEDEAILPALTDADEDGGFNEELVADGIDEEKAAELDEKLDSFFDFDSPDETTEQEEEVVAVIEESASPAAEQPSAEVDDSESDLGESDEELDSFFDFSDDVADDDATKEDKASVDSWKDEILAADIVEPEGEEEGLLEREEDYDSFFDFDSDENEDEMLSDEQTVAATAAVDDDEFDISLDDFDDEQVGEEIAVALADADEERGFNEDEMSSGIADEKAAELDEKLNFFFELDKDEQDVESGDQISSAEENEAVSTGTLAESDTFDEEQDEASLGFLELDEDSSELSFDEEDFDGDIAGFSLDTDDTGDTEAVSEIVDQGHEIASNSDEEIEGLDAIFDLDDDVEGVPEFDTLSAGEPEEIPALEDEFVVSLDDEEESTDELFDFFSESGEEEHVDISPVLAKDTVVAAGPLDEVAGAELEDEFTLSLEGEETSDDDFENFSFKSEENESDLFSEPIEEAEALDSFFELEEGTGEAEAVPAATDLDDKVGEEARNKDQETGDDEFSLLFGDDEFGEKVVSPELNTSEETEDELSLDDEDSSEDVEGVDSFLDLEEDLGESLELEGPKGSSSLEESVEEIELGDEFALSLGAGDGDDDELSAFSFSDDDDDASAIAFESTEELDAEDSLFGLNEESDGEPETSAIVDEDDSEDELTLSLDTEDTDELSDFSFGSDD
ncbi:MAG: hypothetical protein WBM35_13470, partial [Candidatus Electrothrix sp.]